jgi:DNA-directed RNA polymerase specialized sigma24 family protein
MASTLLEMPTTPLPDVKKERGLGALAFARLLVWLDDGVDSYGERYLEMRQRLISYFDRRDRPFADDLADETLNRIGQTLERGDVIAIRPQARYCYIVARFVLLEDIRRGRRRVGVDESWVGDDESSVVQRRAADLDDERSTDIDERLEHLDQCLQELTTEQRTLIVEYYRDDGREKIARRADMARRLGITINALSIRACRIRTMLQGRMAAASLHRVSRSSHHRSEAKPV